MKKSISILLVASILSFFLSACGQVEKEYIIMPCPKLQTYEVNATNRPPLKIQYEVVPNAG